MQTFLCPVIRFASRFVAAILHVSAHVFLIIAVFRAATEWLDRPSAWIATALLAVQPLVTSPLLGRPVWMVGGYFFYFSGLCFRMAVETDRFIMT